jgi:antirestriction protein
MPVIPVCPNPDCRALLDDVELDQAFSKWSSAVPFVIVACPKCHVALGVVPQRDRTSG